jgi:hypothetical protein
MTKPHSESGVESPQERLKGTDRVETVGKATQAAAGAGFGLAVSGTMAHLAGATTILGSTKIAALVGLAFATTPVGWVLGSAVVGSAMALGLGAAIASGAKNTERRKQLIRDLNALDAGNSNNATTGNEIYALEQRLRQVRELGLITEVFSTRILNLVSQGKLSLKIAIMRLDDLQRASAAGRREKSMRTCDEFRPIESMTVMQESPEQLVGSLLGRLHSLRGATAFLNDPDLSERLVSVTRRLTLTDVLSKQSVIAIAGSQGAGKTTLVKSLYELDDTWLVGNEGRGERSPVLILESPDINEPVATVLMQSLQEINGQLEYVQQDVDVSPADFHRAVLGELPGQLLPKLTLPSRYFNGNACGLLLLPGHETITKRNLSWQVLVRQSLVGSDMCIIVTDETRLANNEQTKILDDFRSNLDGASPIVVITKTEGKSAEALASLVISASEAFALSTEASKHRVICSSTQRESMSEWKGKLAAAMEELTQIQQKFRARQLHQLHDILSEELSEVLIDIDMATRIAIVNSKVDYGGPVQDILAAFDSGKNRLRRAYLKELKISLEDYCIDSTQLALKVLTEREEGLLNQVGNTWRWLRTTTGERENIIPQYVQNSWQAPWELDSQRIGNFGNAHQRSMRRVTMTLLGAPKSVNSFETLVGWNVEQELGYHSTGQTPVVWKAPNERQRLDLARIFAKDGENFELSRNMLDAIELLPAIALEYSRIGSLFPSLLGIRRNGLMFGTSNSDNEEHGNLVSLMGQQGIAILAVIGTMIGVESASKLLDVVPSESNIGDANDLLNSMSTVGVAQSIVGSMAVLLGAGLLVINFSKSIQRTEGQARDIVRKMTAAIRDAHYAHFNSEFDHLMDNLRERLESSLRKRYQIDAQVVRLDHLKKSHADVQMLSLDLREALAKNPSFSLV